MRKSWMLILMVVVSVSSLFAAGDRDKAMERVKESGKIIDEIMAAPDSGIPSEILDSARCVAVVPSLLKGGFIVGGAYGYGLASCRTDAGWSAPAFFGVKGGSFGLQIGGQAVDLVMIIMNDDGMRDLLQSKFKLGVDAGAAVGPVGRHAEGSTDWKMRAKVLTYSRARGVFAGLSVNGATIRQDQDTTRDFYGHMVPYKSLLTGLTAVPADAEPFTGVLAKYAGKGSKTDTKADPKAGKKN